MLFNKKGRRYLQEEVGKRKRRLPVPLIHYRCPHLEACIAEALPQGEEEVPFADWLLDPEQDLPMQLLYGEEEAPSFPGEGTSSSFGLLPHVASELEAGEPLELPLSPGEGTSSALRELL